MDNNDKKKNLFWILSGVAVFILLVGWVVGWWMITSSTADQEADREGVFSQVTNLQSATIPNTGIKNELETKKEALTDSVFKIWQERWDAQDEFFKNTLSPQTQNALSLLTQNDVSTLELDKYHQVLKDEVLELYEVIDLRHLKEENLEETVNQGGNAETPSAAAAPGAGGRSTASQSGGDGGAQSSVTVGSEEGGGGQSNAQAPASRGGRGGRGGANRPQNNTENAQPKAEYLGIVDWQDRARVLEGYLGWGNRTPTPEQLKYAVEYWACMYSVLDVVAKTNSGASQHFEAPIKQIRALRIGRIGPQREGGPKPDGDGQALTGNPDDPGSARQTAASATGGGGAGGAQSTITVGGEEGGGGGAGRGAASLSAPDYSPVNPEWGLAGFELPEPTPQPTKIAELEKGRYVDDNGYPIFSASSNPHVEFRMIPLYMEVVIDQSHINRFFDIAAASPLPIEVQQICALHSVPNDIKNAKGNSVEFSPNDVILKIRGVIYFYRPPVKDNLGKKPSEIQPAEGVGETAKP